MASRTSRWPISNDSSIGILLGLGDGTFHPVVTYPAGLSPQALVLADFNSDGEVDIAAARSGSSISILAGQGRRDVRYGSGYSFRGLH